MSHQLDANWAARIAACARLSTDPAWGRGYRRAPIPAPSEAQDAGTIAASADPRACRVAIEAIRAQSQYGVR